MVGKASANHKRRIRAERAAFRVVTLDGFVEGQQRDRIFIVAARDRKACVPARAPENERLVRLNEPLQKRLVRACADCLCARLHAAASLPLI